MASFPTSKQHTELLRSRPSSYVQYDLEALRVFVQWAETSQVPRSAEVSLLLNRFASDVRAQVRSVDIDLVGKEVIGELLQWIEASREECSLPEEAVPALSLFLSYQNRIQGYKDSIRNYWFN